MKEYMGKKGYKQGDMNPKVDDYQKPEGNYPEKQMGKTDEYIERKDKHERMAAKKVERQEYKGRYS